MSHVTWKDGALTVLVADLQPYSSMSVAVVCSAGPAHVLVSFQAPSVQTDGGPPPQVQLTDQY